MTRPEKIRSILLAAFIIAIYLYALGIPLLGPDEPRYAQVAKEMFERGDWVTPTLGGYNWFEKPSLLYWLQITFYSMFGVTEYAARLGSALFGLGTILSLFVLGICGVRRTATGIPYSEFPFWLMLVSASSLGLAAFSRGASFDIVVTFPITASLVAFFVWETRSSESTASRHTWLLFIFYFFIGVALLAKGLIGIVFPFAIVAFYYVLRRKLPDKSLFFSILWGTAVSLIVASAWYLPMYLQHGWEFIDEFFVQHHFARYSSNKYRHPQPFWFFWIVLPLMTIPWIPFFALSVWDFIRSGFRIPETNSHFQAPNQQLRIFAFAWMLVPLVFFSMSGSKLPGYILPSLPAVCILTAEYVSRFVRSNRKRKYAVQTLGFVTLAVYAGIIHFALPKFAEWDSVKGLTETINSTGYRTEKILNGRNISHNLEFYGAGRLVRLADGKQRRFENMSEIDDFMSKEVSQRVLVLIPLESITEFDETGTLKPRLIAENGELAILAVTRKPNENN